MNLTLKEERIKDDLIEVSKKLFQQFGFVKTTMEDIAKTARKSKSTLYRFFKNKEEVLHGVITKEIYELHYVVVKESSKGRTSAEKLRLYLKTILTETRKKLLIYALIKGECRWNLKVHQKRNFILHHLMDDLNCLLMERSGGTNARSEDV